MNTFGQYLKEKREHTGMSQTTLAKKMGWSGPQFVSNLERGRANIPVRSLTRFCKLIKITPQKAVEAHITKYAKELNTRVFGTK